MSSISKLNVTRHGYSLWQTHSTIEKRLRKGNLTNVGLYIRPYKISDQETPLLQCPDQTAQMMGAWLVRQPSLPDVFVVSPTVRTEQTYQSIIGKQSSLAAIPHVIDEGVIEQNYGIVDQYGGFQAFLDEFPRERRKFEECGRYHYVIPGGESIAQVCDRATAWLAHAHSRYAGLHVHVISHHRFIMGMRKDIEEWDIETFLRIDHDPQWRPHNSLVTMYSDHGSGLELEFINEPRASKGNQCSGE